MRIFELFGSIAIEDNGVDKKLDSIDKKGGSLSAKLSDMAGMAVKAGVALTAMGAVAVGALAVKGVQSAEELQKALNGLQASTGTADNSMSDMKQSMLDIYNNNFGESFEDIGKSMSYISQQTGLAGQALTKTTENAIALKDTFEIEVEESIKSVDIMMKNFGVTSEQAMNLLAQGAQKGLNKNQDLTTMISEYAPHFAELGLGAEQMFNMLSNGTKHGIFDVEKMGDAVHEFGIRARDGSKTSAEAFRALGFDAEKTTAEFGKGGEAAANQFKLVTEKLNSMEDPILKYNTGVALFGTMWEEVQSKGMMALTDTTKGISLTEDALKKINAIKYNTFGEAIAGIGRQFETGVFVPLGEKILPKLGELATWFQSKMPQIKIFIDDAMIFASQVFDKVWDILKTNLLPVLNDLWMWVQPYLPQIKEFMRDTFESISTKYIPAVMGVFNSLVKNVLPTVIDIFNFIVSDIMPPVIEIFKWIYTEIIPQLAKKFQEWIPKIMDVINTLWKELKPVIDFITDAFVVAFPIIKKVVEITIDRIGAVISGLLTTLKGVIQFVSGVFSGDWGKVWEGIKNIFSGVWESIYGVLKSQVNGIIFLMNKMVDSLNKLKFSVPDWVPGMGGKEFSLKIPRIPQLAKGGNILDNGSVMVGEKGPEILSNVKGATVTPLNKSGVTININNPTLFNDRDADKLGELIVGRLKTLGVVM